MIKMSYKPSNEIKDVIQIWFNKEGSPVKMNSEFIDEIANLCENHALDRNRDTFRSEIQKLISEHVRHHILRGRN